jgi:pyruvate dehydrogenase E1 component alpha subunit
MRRDPILRFRKKLHETGIITPDEISQVEQKVNEAIDDAVKYAIDSPFPKPEEALEDVYA